MAHEQPDGWGEVAARVAARRHRVTLVFVGTWGIQASCTCRPQVRVLWHETSTFGKPIELILHEHREHVRAAA